MTLSKAIAKRKKLTLHLLLFAAITACGITAHLVNLDPNLRDWPPFEPPSRELILGSNSEGQSMASRLVCGIGASLLVGCIAGAIATAIGSLIGIVAGYVGGIVDDLLTSITNLFIVIPTIVILIIVGSSIEKRSLLLVACIIGLTNWSWTALALRAQTLSLKRRDHIMLARLNGFGSRAIIIKQIVPYLGSYLFMSFVIQMATGIMSESAISLLGLGPYATPTLGNIIDQAQRTEALQNGCWWTFIPATLVVTILQFSLLCVNTDLENAFNPRLRKLACKPPCRLSKDFTPKE